MNEDLPYKPLSLPPLLERINNDFNTLSNKVLVFWLDWAASHSRSIAMQERSKATKNKVALANFASNTYATEGLPIMNSLAALPRFGPNSVQTSLSIHVKSASYLPPDSNLQSEGAFIQFYVNNQVGSVCYAPNADNVPVKFDAPYNLTSMDTLHIEVLVHNQYLAVARGHADVDPKDLAHVRNKAVDLEIFSIDWFKKKLGTISFDVRYVPLSPNLISLNQGFVYSPYLPVLDPSVPLPPVAQPSQAWSTQDKLMKDAMMAIAVYWMARGAENALSVIPQRLPARSWQSTSDDWWVDRRLNGFNPGFLVKNPKKSDADPWDYYIEWDFSYLDPSKHLKAAILFPKNIVARFILTDNGANLKSHSIQYTMRDKKTSQDVTTVVLNDGSLDWKYAQRLFQNAEVNINFTWTHVGVHFNVEQYAMAAFRNWSTDNPLWDFLTPHFKDIIVNDREVVRPKTALEGGVVTIAGTLTYEGQIRMLQERFKGFSYKWTPASDAQLPDTLSAFTRRYQTCEATFWQLVTEYVDGWWKDNADSIKPFWDSQIKPMSDDLVTHALNTTPGSMAVTTMDELRQMCIYVIFQAVFYHDWVHWAGWDDFFPALIYDRSDPACPSGTGMFSADGLEDLSNNIQAFVTYASPTLKQWPVLDPELGAPAAFQALLKKYANVLNQPNMQIGSYVTACNT